MDADPLCDYINLFRNNSKSLLEKRPSSAIWDYRNDTVLTTYEISLVAVEGDDPLASKILTICGFLDRLDVWPDMLRAGLGLPLSGNPIASLQR